MHTRLRAPEYVGIARKINLLSPIVNHRWDGLGQGQGQSEQNIFCNRNGCDVCRPVGRVTLTAYFQWSRPKSKERTEKKKKKLKTLISSRFFFYFWVASGTRHTPKCTKCTPRKKHNHAAGQQEKKIRYEQILFLKLMSHRNHPSP